MQDKKIASIGLKKRGFCYHGISKRRYEPFDGIVTCGIDSLEVTQINGLKFQLMKSKRFLTAY